MKGPALVTGYAKGLDKKSHLEPIDQVTLHIYLDAAFWAGVKRTLDKVGGLLYAHGITDLDLRFDVAEEDLEMAKERVIRGQG